MSDNEQIKNASLRYPSRPGSIDVRAMNTNFYPFDAFEFDDPNTNAEPRVRLKDPWLLDVGTIIASEVQGGVIVEGTIDLALNDGPAIEVIYDGQYLYWTKAGAEGCYKQSLSEGASAIQISTKDFRRLFKTTDDKVGGISVGDLQGVWVEDLRVVTDPIVDVAFKDYANIYCVLNTNRKVYKYDYLTSTSSLYLDDVVMWVTLDDQGNLIYQNETGIYSYNGTSSTLIISGTYYDISRGSSIWVIKGLDGKIYYYDDVLVDSGLVCYDVVALEDSLIYINTSQEIVAQLENQLLEGIKLQGDSLSANFIGTSTAGSATLIAYDSDQMKKIFRGDFITGQGWVNAEVITKGGNYVVLDGDASSSASDYTFSLSGTRLTLNANQVIIPGTLTANEIVLKGITRDVIADGAISTDQVDEGNLSISSSDYDPGVAGWAIDKDGDVEFNSGTFRGTLTLGGKTGADLEQDTTDAQDDATLALSNAATAQSAAEDAQDDATEAKEDISDIVADAKFTNDEKIIVRKELEEIDIEYTENVSTASTYSISSSAYTTAYNALHTYIDPFVATTTTDDIVRSTFTTKFNNYYTARQELLDAIAVKAKDLADDAQTEAESKVTTFRQGTTPSALRVGDIWIDTSKDDLMQVATAVGTGNWEQISLRGGTWTSPASSAGWGLLNNGNLYANDGHFRGDITGASGTFSGDLAASTGYFGDFTISGDSIESAGTYDSLFLGRKAISGYTTNEYTCLYIKNGGSNPITRAFVGRFRTYGAPRLVMVWGIDSSTNLPTVIAPAQITHQYHACRVINGILNGGYLDSSYGETSWGRIDFTTTNTDSSSQDFAQYRSCIARINSSGNVELLSENGSLLTWDPTNTTTTTTINFFFT